MKLHEEVKKWNIEMKITILLLGSGLTRDKSFTFHEKKKNEKKRLTKTMNFFQLIQEI